MLGRVLVKPDPGRPLEFDSVYNPGGRPAPVHCAKCGSLLSINFCMYVGRPCFPEEVAGVAWGVALRAAACGGFAYLL